MSASRFPHLLRAGFRPMQPVHEQFLLDKGITSPLLVEDKSLGAVCLHWPSAAAEPLVAMILSKCSNPKEAPSWSFAKGHPDEGEEDVAGAVREVQEEMGLDISGCIVPSICVEQNYCDAGRMHSDAWKKHAAFPDEAQRPACVFYKLVRYYLAVLPQASALVPQEAEVAECAWVPVSEALQRLAQPEAKELFAEFFSRPEVLAHAPQ